MKLLALIIAFAVSHWISNPERLRNFDWLQELRNWVVKKKFFESVDINMLIILFIPIAFVQIVVNWLFDSNFSVFLISVVVLLYCIGPKSLEEQLSSPVTEDNNQFSIERISYGAMKKWFGIFFWYVVLGIIGVLLYRFTERLCYNEKERNYSESFDKLLKILNYPVSWMMVLALAIASDFERVYLRCKSYMNLDSVKKLDNQFLFDAMDFAVKNCEMSQDADKKLELITLDVLQRMLIVCLVFVSILVILAI